MGQLILETYYDKTQHYVRGSLVREGPIGWDLLGDYSEDRVLTPYISPKSLIA